MASIARQTLLAARYFLAKAIETPESDLTIVGYNIQAAIVFSRSLTFHIQKEFSEQPGFDTWYEQWRSKMKANAICTYFVEQRNYVLKEGLVGLARSVTVFIDAGLSMSGEVSAVVIRAAPWYRRSLRTLWEDFSRPMRERLFKIRKLRAFRKQRKDADAEKPTRAVTLIHFEDSPTPGRSATALVEEYLAFLELIVIDAESRFVVA